MKDHEIAAAVNELTSLAYRFGNTAQCRDRISEFLQPKLKEDQIRILALDKELLVQTHALNMETKKTRIYAIQADASRKYHDKFLVKLALKIHAWHLPKLLRRTK